MRSVALLFVLFFSTAVPIAEPAFAVESKILDTFKSWLNEEPDINDLEGLRELAAKENPEAQFLLFQHYISHSRQGAGARVANETLASRAEAEAGLRAAAEQGHPEAVSLLGAMLARGGPLLRNQVEARKWLELAIEKGVPERRTTVEYLLAEILLFSPESTDADRQRGLAMAEALLPREPDALRHKANALRQGAGVAQNAAEARRILEEGVAAGNEYAPAPLGEMLVKGEGGPPDVERGIELLSSKAANRGLGNAILGELYLEGKLVGPNPRKGDRADCALCGERLRAAPEARRPSGRLMREAARRRRCSSCACRRTRTWARPKRPGRCSGCSKPGASSSATTS